MLWSRAGRFDPVTNFYVLPEDVTDDQVLFRAAEAKHLCAVYRRNVGDVIAAVDGQGNEYSVVMEQVSKQSAVGRVLRRRRRSREPVSRVILGQAMTKGATMDLVIQKATELGIDLITVFKSTYSGVKNSPASRLERWTRIALEACKQCNRPKPPDLHAAGNLDEFLKSTGENSYDLKLIFWEEERQTSLQDIFQQYDSIRSVLLLIGPEGGFSAVEAEQARVNGFQPVTLGSRILRAETAAMAAIAVLQYELGNLS